MLSARGACYWIVGAVTVYALGAAHLVRVTTPPAAAQSCVLRRGWGNADGPTLDSNRGSLGVVTIADYWSGAENPYFIAQSAWIMSRSNLNSYSSEGGVY